jgi:hypothetical protein
MKVGRNDPCPCGSGKKYKKCCAAKEDMSDLSLPEELLTGTRLDDYMHLMQPISIYYHGLTQFDKDRKELKKAVKDFEKDFQPGEESGINDGLFVPWYLFDLRFGKSAKTVCERFLEDDMMKNLNEPGPTLIRHMSDSYATLYEITKISQERIGFIELGTGASWSVNRLHDPNEEKMAKGDIWYVRFVGPADDAFEFSAPYIFSPEAKNDLTRVVKAQVEETRKTLKTPMGQNVLFKESCKASLPGWVDYILYPGDDLDDKIFDDEPLKTSVPMLLNTDGETMRFCKIVFKVIDEKDVKAALTSLKDFDYDERNKTWIWFKKGNKQISILPTTALGTLTIKRGKLITEANSEERAEKLVKKLKKALQGIALFEKIEVKDFDELPPVSEKNRKRVEAERAELMKKPEVREVASQMAEDYYHKDWLQKPLPALDGLTPLEAVKTLEGKHKVEEILKDIEMRQNRNLDKAFQVDVNGLRKRLQIVVKKN